MTAWTDLLAEVVIAIAYRDTEYDVRSVVADIVADHGWVRLADLDPDAFVEILGRHRR